MKKYRLSFCSIISLTDNIAETTVDENIEIDNAMISEYNHWLAEYHDGNFGILVNKKNNYNYSCNARLEIGTVNRIQAIAVVVPDASREASAISIFNSKLKRDIPRQVFYDRDSALTWLKQTLGT